jgi:Peptidase family M28
MSRILLSAILLAAALVSAGLSDDLYQVSVLSEQSARSLKALGAVPVVRLNDGYLILVNNTNSSLLLESGLSYRLIATGVSLSDLALDNRLDRVNVSKFQLLFEDGGVRLYRMPAELKSGVAIDAEIRAIDNSTIEIEFSESTTQSAQVLFGFNQLDIGLDTLIQRVSQDSLQSYLLQLQGFPYRRAGSLANFNSRDWIISKLSTFGYDSVVVDTFLPAIGGIPTQSYNVLAYKIGSKFPNHQVIVGAHRDAVAASPGADDNGTGTCGVLEIARCLIDIPTDMTIIFALFDAEEDGLLGSNHYVQVASARGDSIVYMLNMDMIGHYQNTNLANVFHGSITTLSNVWIHLADSLVGITGTLAGASSGSDHYPFTQKGYDASFVAESIFSTVYHSFRDSTSYVSFPYMTKLVKASLATTYVVNATAGPKPLLVLDYPEGVPATIPSQTNATMKVRIRPGYGGTTVEGTEKLCYSSNGNPFLEVNMTQVTLGHYEAILPKFTCNDKVRYFARAEESTNGLFYSPDSVYAGEIVVATSTIPVFAENFELDNGWVATGNASDGLWSRGFPVGLGDRGDPPTDFDGSGQCFVTDNVYGNSDVDNGTVWLTSPSFDMSSGNGRIHYARWFSNNFGAAPNEDVFRVYVSNNNGSAWTLVETVGPIFEAGGEWFEHSFWVADFVAPASQMKLMFEAADLGSGSVIEAAVDDVTVTRFECIPPTCCINNRGNANGDAGDAVNVVDLTFLVQYLFQGGAAPPCKEEADVVVNGSVNVVDLTTLVQRLFQGGPPPPACP